MRSTLRIFQRNHNKLIDIYHVSYVHEHVSEANSTYTRWHLDGFTYEKLWDENNKPQKHIRHNELYHQINCDVHRLFSTSTQYMRYVYCTKIFSAIILDETAQMSTINWNSCSHPPCQTDGIRKYQYYKSFQLN